MKEHVDNAITVESRTGHATITYCADNTLDKALESSRVYVRVLFGGKKIGVNEILKNFLTRDDVQVVMSESTGSYKVFYNGSRHHVYQYSVLANAVKALCLIVPKV